jgi:hypothetical protein
VDRISARRRRGQLAAWQVNINSASGEFAVYETYPPNQAPDCGEAARRAQQAIQVALDRRDNGGDSAAERAE